MPSMPTMYSMPKAGIHRDALDELHLAAAPVESRENLHG